MTQHQTLTPYAARQLRPLRESLAEAARFICNEAAGQEIDIPDLWRCAHRLADQVRLLPRRGAKDHKALIWRIYDTLFYYQQRRQPRWHRKLVEPSQAELEALLASVELWIRQL